MKSAVKSYTVKLEAPKHFNLEQTLNCGQCFRFLQKDEGKYCGVAFNKYFEFTIDNNLLIASSDSEISEKDVTEFFDFDRDYDKINFDLSQDKTMAEAIKYAGGIRILRQPYWETLCSFILSQNNNIKRITGIIERLCQNFGDDIGNGHYSFPSAERIAALSLDDLAPIRSGFRAKYIIDAAQKVSNKEVDFDKIVAADTETARQMLMKIKGVGPKVADCVLLFGFHKLDAFPKDVWIKKALEEFYPDGVPEFFKEYGGIAQQYLFHYIRTKLN